MLEHRQRTNLHNGSNLDQVLVELERLEELARLALLHTGGMMGWGETFRAGIESATSYSVRIEGTTGDLGNRGQIVLPRPFFAGSVLLRWVARDSVGDPVDVTLDLFDSDDVADPIALVNGELEPSDDGGTGVFGWRSRTGQMWVALTNGAPDAVDVLVTCYQDSTP